MPRLEFYAFFNNIVTQRYQLFNKEALQNCKNISHYCKFTLSI